MTKTNFIYIRLVGRSGENRLRLPLAQQSYVFPANIETTAHSKVIIMVWSVSVIYVK